MLKRPNDWDNIEPIEYGEREVLELGGHEVIIKNAYEYTGQSGNTSLKVEVDIAGNDKQAGFFQRQYDNNMMVDRKWPNGACKYISLKEDENCIALFKGFTTAVENSNPGYVWNFDEKSLINKKLCGVFALEEYEKQDGTIGTAVKLSQFRSLDKLSEVKIPRVKLLNGDQIDYEIYKNSQKNVAKNNKTVQKNDKIDEFIEENLLD